MVAEGALSPGSRMPTVRRLAADLGLAANTVARAYRELETDGVIATHGRKGTFVSSAVIDHDTSPDRTTGERARAAADAYVASVRALGLGVTEATRLVEAGLVPHLTGRPALPNGCPSSGGSALRW